MATRRVLMLIAGLVAWTWVLLPAPAQPVDAGETGAAATASEPEAETESPDPRLWAPGEGEHLWVFPESSEELGAGGEFHVYVDPMTIPGARASFARFALGPGGALPMHRHAKTEEIAYFVSGQGLVQLVEGDETTEVQVGPGHVWYNPPGAWHSVRNTGEEPLVLVFAAIPNEKKGLMTFFRKISVKPGEEPTELPPEEFARIAAEHDMILRPPEEPTEAEPVDDEGTGGSY